MIDFDFRLVDLFERMERSSLKIEQLLAEEYERIKDELGHRPSRTEFFTYLDDRIYVNVKSKSKIKSIQKLFSVFKETKRFNKARTRVV